MIMILTHRNAMRDQLTSYLRERNYEVCVPAHRQDVRGLMKQTQPSFIILDLYLAEPSGAHVIRTLREDGYSGRILVLSAPSMTSVLKDLFPNGADEVMQFPAEIEGQFHFGQIENAIGHS